MINKLAKEHHTWVSSMGWHNKSNLECLALVGKEVGEACEEVRSGIPTPNFKYELADIILRVFDLAVANEIDLEKTLVERMERNKSLERSLSKIL